MNIQQQYQINQQQSNSGNQQQCSYTICQQNHSCRFYDKIIPKNQQQQNQINDNKEKQQQSHYSFENQQLSVRNQSINQQLESKQFNQFSDNIAQQSYFSQSQLSKVKNGLPNLGQTSYINSAIQQLKQFYYIDKTIFGSSTFGQHFKDLFNHLENGNSKTVKTIIENIFDMALQQQQQARGGGDAYMCIYNFLNSIKKSLPDDEKEEFNSNFLLKYSDHLECLCCNTKIQNTIDEHTFYQYEEFGQECISLSHAFSDEGDQSLFQALNPDIICQQCKQKQFLTKREYQVAPNFMMIRLLNHDSKPNHDYKSNDNILQQEFDLIVQGQQFIEKYQIIGFCQHNQHRYQYQAKYGNQWLQFDDNQVYFTQNPNCSNTLYYVLKKIQNTRVEYETKSKQLLAKPSPAFNKKNNQQERQYDGKIKQENSQKQNNTLEIKNSSNNIQYVDYTNRNSQNQQITKKVEAEQEEELKKNEANIQLENNQQTQNNYEKITKINSFVKDCNSLHMLESRQYIIPVIQTLMQIYYFIDEELFDQSPFGYLDFKILIKFLKIQNIQNAKSLLENIFIKIGQTKKYQKSSKAYSYFHDLLYDIMSKLIYQQDSHFIGNFFIQYCDRFICQNCQFKIYSLPIFTIQDQEIHKRMLDDEFCNDNDLSTQYIIQQCSKCQKSQGQQRLYLKAPNFMIINQISKELKQSLSANINKSFTFKLYDGSIQVYKIIGFCNQINNKYSYTAKCEDTWVEIKQQPEYDVKPNCSNAQYLVLQKQI
ncbi:ubiquitin carboxyl-terminal hydrolase family protein, putative (macronuclear) [Tetrahymena thermophila SB210]|uniref:Ubiquitin carboxyl-terminal hydrolase family protein, putative n=1 Tax=Tetrahymena thermophila (strain SB210) TaxID=312017 RepID=Q238S7_TETTS|nr:ubiquitin carboxyl-terminal hydrolase family protein, putative [Tetrahymena thermophila SB210]EAR93143.1 ubiquitin carboxyl-terminal hydrolase family protein, putative [Tetrahymena thermophila SB210]|eukprot:XP_001013388.1 ubiquitin carboxyl-terminal hydrolase family protein, putative [Tetrahymena thermophila SB210]